MYHSVYLQPENEYGNVINTYSDWHLIPNGLPVISMPSVKTTYVDIPGASGQLDLSETLTKFPLYDTRSGSLDFIVLDEYTDRNITSQPWSELYQEMADFIHGRRMRLTLEDDIGYYYEGRMSVSQWSPGNGTPPSVRFEYEFDPFKYTQSNQTLTKSSSISSAQWNLDRTTLGRMPVDATYTISNIGASGINIELTNDELGIANRVKSITENGTYKFYDMTLSKVSKSNTCRLNITGSGYVIVTFRKGDL